ncbi:MAG: hypothetical protein K6C34_00685 [Alphaproteobacteria bacterium]|nr:hypothetical protein [Alphaproteobacteria bacterium]
MNFQAGELARLASLIPTLSPTREEGSEGEEQIQQQLTDHEARLERLDRQMKQKANKSALQYMTPQVDLDTVYDDLATQLQRQSYDLNRQIIAGLETQKKDLLAQITALSAQLEDKDKKIEILSGELQKAQAALTTLELTLTTLSQKQQENAGLRSKIETLSSQLTKLQTQFDQWKQHVDDRIAQLSKKDENWTTTLKGQLEAAVRNKLKKTIEEQIQQLQSQIDTLKQKVSKAETSQGKYIKSYEDTLQRLNSLPQVVQQDPGGIEGRTPHLQSLTKTIEEALPIFQNSPLLQMPTMPYLSSLWQLPVNEACVLPKNKRFRVSDETIAIWMRMSSLSSFGQLGLNDSSLHADTNAIVPTPVTSLTTLPLPDNPLLFHNSPKTMQKLQGSDDGSTEPPDKATAGSDEVAKVEAAKKLLVRAQGILQQEGRHSNPPLPTDIDTTKIQKEVEASKNTVNVLTSSLGAYPLTATKEDASPQKPAGSNEAAKVEAAKRIFPEVKLETSEEKNTGSSAKITPASRNAERVEEAKRRIIAAQRVLNEQEAPTPQNSAPKSEKNPSNPSDKTDFLPPEIQKQLLGNAGSRESSSRSKNHSKDKGKKHH